MDLRQQLQSVRGDESVHAKIATLVAQVDELEARIEELENRQNNRAELVRQDQSLPVLQE